MLLQETAAAASIRYDSSLPLPPSDIRSIYRRIISASSCRQLYQQIERKIHMNITVLAVGKLKEKYWTDAVNEYSKRLSRYASLKIIELKESLLRSNPSPADEEAVKIAEGREILGKIKKNDYVITLEIGGKSLSSEKLAEKINTLAIDGVSDIVFVIGGSLGLSQEVSRRSDFKLSFSAMTFPHQMMRVILLEQIYRSFKIIRHEAYHK